MRFRDEDELVEVVCPNGHWTAITVQDGPYCAALGWEGCGAALPIRFRADLDQKFRQAGQDEDDVWREKRSSRGAT